MLNAVAAAAESVTACFGSAGSVCTSPAWSSLFMARSWPFLLPTVTSRIRSRWAVAIPSPCSTITLRAVVRWVARSASLKAGTIASAAVAARPAANVALLRMCPPYLDVYGVGRTR